MRKILLPIDPSSYAKTAFQYASIIAKQKNATLEGTAIIDVLDVIEQAATYLPLPQGIDGRHEQEDKLLEDVRKKVRDELKFFEQACQQNHIKCTLKTFEGRPDFIIEKESQFSDLIVIGMRNFFHFETEKNPETSLQKILRHVITPILAVPEKYRPVNKVLMAYDGSMPSMRAIQRFAFMMRESAYEAILLTKSDNEQEAHENFNQLENYLASHGEVTVTRKWTSQSLIKTFENEFLNQVDMVVCGMHSQNFLKSFFVGSFTKYLIDLNKIPVFIGQ